MVRVSVNYVEVSCGRVGELQFFGDCENEFGARD